MKIDIAIKFCAVNISNQYENVYKLNRTLIIIGVVKAPGILVLVVVSTTRVYMHLVWQIVEHCSQYYIPYCKV